MRIATWNLQRVRGHTNRRFEPQLKRIREVDADIWILTETHDDMSPGSDYQGFSTQFTDGPHSKGEGRTAIWSRLPVIQQVQTHDRDSAICIEVDAPVGAMLFYGTVLPYHEAGTRWAYRSGGIDQIGKRSWHLHYESIVKHEQDWAQLKKAFPNHQLCVGGDLNQSRDGRRWGDPGREWYGTKKGRDLLSTSLEKVGLRCVTEQDFVASGQLQTKSSVEHFCVTKALEARVSFVGAWEADLLNDKPISDHNGLYIDLF